MFLKITIIIKQNSISNSKGKNKYLTATIKYIYQFNKELQKSFLRIQKLLNPLNFQIK